MGTGKIGNLWRARSHRRRIAFASALGTALVIGALLFPLSALSHDASDFFMFAKAEHGGATNSNELICNGSNDKQADVSGDNNVIHGRIHSNADIAAASGSGNSFNGALTYGTHGGTCQEQSEGTNTYNAGQPQDVSGSPDGVNDGWPGDLNEYVVSGLTIDSVEDALPGELCDVGNLSTGSNYTINPLTDNGKVICRGSGDVILNQSGVTMSITVLSHGLIHFSGQNNTLTPAAHGILAFSDRQQDNAIRISGSNFQVPVASILFAPQGGIDTSGSDDSEMCIQLIGQGPIKLPGSRNTVGPGSAACTNIVPGQPDVKVTKVGNGTVGPGGTAQFTIEIENIGTADAIDVDIVDVDEFPGGSNMNWSLASQGFGPGFTGGSACSLDSSDDLDCEIATLAPGAKYRVVVTAPVTTSTTCGNKPNTVEVEANNEPANVLGNNEASDTIVVPCPPGTLVVYKQVTNNDGGTATASAWTMNVSGPTTLNFPGSGTGTSNQVTPGTYTIGESGGPAGYVGPTFPTSGLPAGASQNCNSSGVVTVASGQTRHCVLRNDDQKPTLIVIKNVVNDHGGTATSGNFTMTVDDPGSNPPSFPGAGAPGTSVTVDTGSYTVTETGPAGYQGSFSADCSGTIAVGQTKTCTVTNDDIPATLIVKKIVVNDHGGTSDADDFSFQVNGGSAVSFEADGQNNLLVAPGTYNVTEPGVPGYATTYDGCANIVLARGQTKTCTITNNDQPGTLTVRKVVVNDDGGTKLPPNFTFQLDGGAAQAWADDGNDPLVSETVLTVSAGTHDVTEPAVAGYTTSYSNCEDVVVAPAGNALCVVTNDDNPASLTVVKELVNDHGGTKAKTDFSFDVAGPSASQDTAFDADGSVTLEVAAGTYTVTENEANQGGYTTTYSNCAQVAIPLGGTATCTITNDDQPATLIVKKTVVNDHGGTADADDFTFQVNGGAAVAFDADGQNDLTVNPGTYNVVEPAVAGYATTYEGCSDIVLAAGQTKTCTVTNDDVPATLIVKKTVVNDNGGTADADDFTFQVNGGAAVAFEADGQNDLTVNPGTYNVVEPAVAGYATTYEGCSDIVLAAGETKTCTVTNDDIPAKLVVIKHVINDNGGTAAAAAFQLTVDDSGSDPPSFPGAESPGTEVTVDPGAYSVSEAPVTGYTQTGASADCQGTIANGETKTCTITNDDNPATLIVYKQVVNDNGGTAGAGAWTMTVSAPAGLSFPGDEAGTSNGVNAGTYTVGETGGPGTYDGPSYPTAGLPQGVQQNDCNQSGQITLAVGETKRCVLRNDDKAPKLTLVKEVVNDNGGSAAPSAWTLTASGPDGFSGAGPSVSSGASFDQGTYTLSESGPDGYTAGNWECTGDGQEGSSVDVGLGDDITCTITNDDTPPKLTLVKEVVNDDGGIALPAAWTLTASGPEGFSGVGPSVSSDSGFDQGTYDLSESGPTGYEASDWSCGGEGEGQSQVDGDTVEVGLGDDITCTITNDDEPATLIVIKNVVNDNGGNAVAGDFQMTIEGVTADGGNSFPGQAAPGTSKTLSSIGAYTVTEAAEPGYTQTAASVDCAGTIALGETKTCTITNNDNPPTITGQGAIDVQKSAAPSSVKEPGGPVDFTVTITNTSALTVTITNVADSVYGDLDDTDGSGVFDVPINLAPGEKVSKTFQRQVTGAGGQVHTNVVTASGIDQAGNPVSDSDDARVEITPRLIDLVIVKTASSPTPINGIVNYTMTVTNKGPDTATNVQLADPAPTGITYLTANPSKGTCNLSTSLITCSLGSLAAGETATINVTARATAVGTHTNVATVTGGGGRETNPADNVDDAVTVVPAPFIPPTQPKPKTKPVAQPPVCLTLTVTPKMIKADGRPDRVSVKVTAGNKRVKGTKVTVFGAGVRKSGRSNGKGMAFIVINPRKAGLITITALETNQRVCGPKRIGVVGVFLPPLTG